MEHFKRDIEDMPNTGSASKRVRVEPDTPVFTAPTYTLPHPHSTSDSPPPTTPTNDTIIPLPLISCTRAATFEYAASQTTILTNPPINNSPSNNPPTNPPIDKGGKYSKSNDNNIGSKDSTTNNPNRTNYESFRGRSKKNKGKGPSGRGGRGGNARGRKGRDDDEKADEGEEIIGEGGLLEEDDVMDDEVAREPIKAHTVDMEALEAVRVPTDPAARKKKVAMLVGYNGSGFCGMQRYL